VTVVFTFRVVPLSFERYRKDFDGVDAELELGGPRGGHRNAELELGGPRAGRPRGGPGFRLLDRFECGCQSFDEKGDQGFGSMSGVISEDIPRQAAVELGDHAARQKTAK